MAIEQGEQRGRRHLRAEITAFVLAPGLIIGTGLWVATYPLQQVVGSALAAPCNAVTSRAPLQNSFTVNILNNGAPQGAASRVAKQVPMRNFRLGQVGNDPGTSSIEGPGVIRYGPAGLDGALVVQRLLLPEAQVISDYRAGTSVDLVLGSGFTQLAPPDRPLVRRDDVAVNVYNTTYFEGLAKKASNGLTQLGFKKGEVGLDPKNAWVTDTAAVRYGPDGEIGARLVQGVVPSARLIRDPSIKGTSVDLLIGMTWKGVLGTDVIAPEPPEKPLERLLVQRPCN